MANLIEATRRLARLRALPEGWDYGAGSPISRRAYSGAANLLQILSRLGAVDFDVAPGDEGGIVIAAYSGDKSAEIHCLSSGCYDFLHETGDEEDVYLSGVSLAKLIIELEGLGWRSPRFYASCTHNAIYRVSSDILPSLSRIPPVVVYQSSTPSVSKTEASGHANTSESFTTNEFAANRRSSGEYRSLPFQEAVA